MKFHQLRISPARGKGTSGKRVLGMVLATMCLVLSPQVNSGWKPDGVMTLQIGFGAGGSTDTMGRVLAKVMKDQTGWNIIAENKTGGGGVAMFTGIAKMPPRGKVIGLGVNMPILVNLVRRGDAALHCRCRDGGWRGVRGDGDAGVRGAWLSHGGFRLSAGDRDHRLLSGATAGGFNRTVTGADAW